MRHAFKVLVAAASSFLIICAVLILHQRNRLLYLSWERIAANTNWTARDAAVALVHNGQMWMIGGWRGVGVPMLTDIWSSSNGLDWKQILPAAPWKHGEAIMAVSFEGRIWVLGGESNQIWSSADGETWTYHGLAPWSPRSGAALVVFAERLWLLGGHDGATYNNEVWSSADGVNWVLTSSSPPWRARAFHTAVSFNGRIWLMGGGVWDVNPIRLNDVWTSNDGVRWEQLTEHARWKGRLWLNAVVYEDAIWLVGGYYRTDRDSRSIWRSVDGQSWERARAPSDFKRRHAAAVFNFDHKIWIAGGYEGGGSGGNDVWAFRYPGPLTVRFIEGWAAL